MWWKVTHDDLSRALKGYRGEFGNELALRDTRIEALEKKLAALQQAFNDWFDIVAPELGFRAEMAPGTQGQVTFNFTDSSGGWVHIDNRCSPRKASVVTSTELERVPPKKRGK
jgi:hypothetical protein